MASTPIFLSPTLLLILCVLLFTHWPLHSASRSTLKKQTGFRIPLVHVDYGRNLTTDQALQRARLHDQQRLEAISNAMISENNQVSPAKLPTKLRQGEYLMNLAIGTPPVQFSAIMDTGSNLIWTHCEGCHNCPNKATLFNPSKSSSFSNKSCNTFEVSDCEDGYDQVNCKCQQNYEDLSSIQVSMSKETFSFGNRRFPNIMFGCGISNKKLSHDTGIVGMGPGAVSFISQLDEPKFSYCLGSMSETSFLQIGFGASSNVKVQTLPLIKGKYNRQYYYIPLEGITVGKTRLATKYDFEIKSDGSGGMIIDSGTTYSYLVENVYNTVERAFVNQTKLQQTNSSREDLCFHLSGRKMNNLVIPRLSFNFNGVDLEFPTKNYMYTKSGVKCLGIFKAEGDVSILGSKLQQNMLVSFDLQKETVSFASKKCDQW